MQNQWMHILIKTEFMSCFDGTSHHRFLGLCSVLLWSAESFPSETKRIPSGSRQKLGSIIRKLLFLPVCRLQPNSQRQTGESKNTLLELLLKPSLHKFTRQNPQTQRGERGRGSEHRGRGGCPSEAAGAAIAVELQPTFIWSFLSAVGLRLWQQKTHSGFFWRENEFSSPLQLETCSWSGPELEGNLGAEPGGNTTNQIKTLQVQLYTRQNQQVNSNINKQFLLRHNL